MKTGHASELALLGMDHLRKLRRQFPPLGELDDVAWDLLRELLRAERNGQRLSVSALSVSVEQVSSTTALRRTQELVKAGHIVRSPDPSDARRDFVALAGEIRGTLDRYLERVASELLGGGGVRAGSFEFKTRCVATTRQRHAGVRHSTVVMTECPLDFLTLALRECKERGDGLGYDDRTRKWYLGGLALGLLALVGALVDRTEQSRSTPRSSTNHYLHRRVAINAACRSAVCRTFRAHVPAGVRQGLTSFRPRLPSLRKAR